MHPAKKRRGVKKEKKKKKTYVRNTQSSQVVLFVLARHLFSTSSGTLAKMRRHIAGRASPQTTSTGVGVGPRIRTSTTSTRLVDGSHGILVRTTSRKMLATANPTLDLLVFQLVLHVPLLAACLLRLLRLNLPVDTGPESNILTHRRRVERGTSCVTLFQAEFRP